MEACSRGVGATQKENRMFPVISRTRTELALYQAEATLLSGDRREALRELEVLNSENRLIRADRDFDGLSPYDSYFVGVRSQNGELEALYFARTEDRALAQYFECALREGDSERSVDELSRETNRRWNEDYPLGDAVSRLFVCRYSSKNVVQMVRALTRRVEEKAE